MLFGVIICLVSVVLLGIDGRFVNPDTYPKVCYVCYVYCIVWSKATAIINYEYIVSIEFFCQHDEKTISEGVIEV